MCSPRRSPRARRITSMRCSARRSGWRLTPRARRERPWPRRACSGIPGAHVSVADSDARDARVVAALMDIVPRGTEEPTKRPSFVADARENGTSRSGATSGSGAGAAQPAWAAMSDSATREEDTALSDAAAALCEARSRRDVATALAARRKQAASPLAAEAAASVCVAAILRERRRRRRRRRRWRRTSRRMLAEHRGGTGTSRGTSSGA